MKRRTLIKSALLLGPLLAGEQLLGPEPAEATGLTVRFYDGFIDGGVLQNWVLWIAITGKRASGLAFDPSTGRGIPLIAYRLRGRFHNNRLQLTFFKFEDLEEKTPVGTLVGHLGLSPIGGKPFNDGVLRGSFHLDDPKVDPSEGAFQAGVVPISRFHTDRLAGVYEAQGLDDQGNLLATAEVHIRRGGAFELRNIQVTDLVPADIPVPQRTSGFFGLTGNGALWTVTNSVSPVFRDQQVPHDPEEPETPESPESPVEAILCFCLLCVTVFVSALSPGRERPFIRVLNESCGDFVAQAARRFETL
jgi:hypothetical protein